MSNSIKKVSLEDMYPIINEQLENGGAVELPITGTSMLPLLIQGRDFVTITSCDIAKKNDIIFYRRDDGHFVLHRVIGKDEKGYILCGDNQVVKEYGIKDEHIIGVVNSIKRKNKCFSVDKLLYKIYSQIWIILLPMRNIILFPIRRIKRFTNNKESRV